MDWKSALKIILIVQVEYMTEDGMSMESRLDEIETFLKRVEREG